MFSRLATDYERLAVLERAPGERLLDMLAVGPKDVVLDLGCGPGNLTRSIRARTGGKLVGIDASAGMVAQARWHARGLGIAFDVGSAEEMAYDRSFNVIFCNSTLHWLATPGRAADGCFRALRRGGWIGVQAPATRQWFSLADQVAAAAMADPRTRGTFAGFRSPIFMLATVEQYAGLFSGSGFDVHDAWIEVETSRHTPREAEGLFAGMAAAAFFNPDCYDAPPDEAFFEGLSAVMRDTVANLAVSGDGLIDVTVQRLYLLAVKPLGG